MSGAPPTELEERAAYGKLAFDRYVLDHWDYARPGEEDQTQWNEIAREWLHMGHTARSSLDGADPNNLPVQMPTQEQIGRVLVPHQTPAERNIALKTEPCLWMRTCYKSSLAPAFEEMTRAIRNDVDQSWRLFDDQALYGSVGPDLVGLYQRMPQLPDTVGYFGYPEDEDLPLDLDPLEPEEENKSQLFDAVLKARGILYLMDEEALKKKMLKLVWTDLGGNPVWWNWLSPEHTRDFEGHYYGLGHALHWLLELGDGNSLYDAKGAVLDIQ